MDLGCGTGAGALALAQRFGGADVTAVDVSASMLGRLQAKARERGLAGRIRTLQADLDAGWPAVGLVDLVWASNSLHHVEDPDQVLAGAFAALRPGGLLAVAEMDSFPRFLPDAHRRPDSKAAARHPGRTAGQRDAAPRLGLGAPPELGRLRDRGPAHVHHRSGSRRCPPRPAASRRPPCCACGPAWTAT